MTTKTTRPTRVERALDLLAGALRWNRRHGKAEQAARIRKAQHDLTPPAPPKPPVTPPKPPAPHREACQSVERAREQSHNGPAFGANECRLRVRIALGAASVGDFDGDGSADAEDGWKAAKHKHPGDRKAPRGFPVYWGGGSRDNGHVAISAGQFHGETYVWSTDILRTGFFDFVPLALIEQEWGLPFLGWTADDAGRPIKNGAVQ